ncbi:hypothetical protein F4553_004737 [Allocatelliglobosispora scoriae]|uniref:DUF3060 domain-containing protein n=1 Tax=Allocatelliglobosispora scoriae TaxID=643052 RepID=A0A841BV78_9ACTN|nr:hypothetical protein [Allocatelliglobosispora scoriae]MBB5871358.1 hypothetical protein [Allocatelliglobosispora scoriae]
MIGHRLARTFSALMLALGLAGSVVLAGCSGEGATATCDGTTSCTVTFERKADPTTINILGLTISLQSATENSITLKVGDQEITLDKGASTSIAGLTVSVDEITDTQVIVKATRN